MARLKTISPRLKEGTDSRIKTVTPGSWRSGKTSSQRGYGYKWQVARAAHLQRHPLCVYCQNLGRVTAATVVDHSEPHRGNPEIFWDQTRWVSLCTHCHSSVKQKEENESRNP